MVVEPLIDPLIDKEPFDVVTVQSPVWADGLDKTELITTWSVVIAVFDIVCGNEENEDEVMTTTFNSSTASATAVPLWAYADVLS